MVDEPAVFGRWFVRPPAACSLEIEIFFEAVQIIEQFSRRMGMIHTIFPISPLGGAHNQIITPNRIRGKFCKHLGQMTFDFILVRNQQITFGAVTAGVI